MNFLVDECLSPTVATLLRDAGHDARHVTELGLAGRPDEAVMAAAKNRNCILGSAHTDFRELLSRSNAPAPSLILFRGADVTPVSMAATLLANLAQFADELEHGAVVVILDDRIRVRRL